MSNWQYANQVPSQRWRSAMTLPRELRLDMDAHGYILTSTPVIETELIRADRIELEPGPISNRNIFGSANKGAHPLYEIDLVFEFNPLEEDGVEFGIVLESDKHEQLRAAFNTRTQQIYIARDESGIIDFSEHFPGYHAASFYIPKEGEIRFHAFIDISSIELFVGQGELVMTELCFPESGFENIKLFSSKESVSLKKGDIYILKSVW